MKTSNQMKNTEYGYVSHTEEKIDRNLDHVVFSKTRKQRKLASSNKLNQGDGRR